MTKRALSKRRNEWDQSHISGTNRTFGNENENHDVGCNERPNPSEHKIVWFVVGLLTHRFSVTLSLLIPIWAMAN